MVPNRLMQLPCKQTNFRTLKDLIDSKYNMTMQIKYIDEEERDVLIESDSILRKAIQKSIRNSYYEDKPGEVTLRFLVSSNT